MTEHIPSIQHVATWRDAEQAVRQIAAQHGISLVLWGVGNPVCKAHVEAVALDAWSSGEMGYTVWVKPQGDGYMNDSTMYTVYVG